MTDQLALFATDAPTPPFPTGATSRRDDLPTAKQAVPSAPVISALQRAVLEAIRSAGEDGLTDDELCLSMPDRCEGTVKRRRTECYQAGAVADSGRTRPTRTTRQAVVWVAV